MINIIINDYFNSILEEYSTNYDTFLNMSILVDEQIQKKDIFYNKLLSSDLDFFTKKNDFNNKKYINKHELEYYPGQKTTYNNIQITNNKITIINNNQHNCCICLETIIDNQQVYNLDCGGTEQPHIYHKSCFEKWNKNSCPYCRTLFIVK